MHIRHWKSQVVTGVLLAASMVLPSTAFAGDGGAGSAGGGAGSGAGVGQIVWTYTDNYGTPTFDNVKKALLDTAHGKKESIELYEDATHPASATINTALKNAINECETRYAKRHAGSSKGANCRLVGVGAVETSGQYTGSTGNISQETWLKAYKASGIPSHTYTFRGTKYKTSATFTNSSDSVNSLVSRETAKKPAVVVIVLSADEPPTGYHLTVSTQQQDGFALSGGTQKVHDRISAHTDTGKKENLTAAVRLHWDAPDGTLNAKTASRNTTITSSGTTDGPEFSHTDFGWKAWAAGTYWYDVAVKKQASLSAAVDTKDREDSEKWSVAQPAPVKKLTYVSGEELTSGDVQAAAMPYFAQVQASTAGAETMTLTDTVFTKNVWFGGKTGDALNDSSTIWVDIDGKKTDAKFAVNDSDSDKRVLTATVSGVSKDIVGTVTLHVLTAPKPTGADFAMDDQARVCWDGKACQDTGHKETPKLTPAPDKAWVLTSKGALSTSDEKWTNERGADTKTFLPSDSISAVVNGRFPKGLSEPLDSYIIADDWSSAAKYVDFSDASKARVYVDGVDRTDAFTIRVEGTTTLATAKPEELRGTKRLAADKHIKLVVSGKMRNDYSTNAAVSAPIKNGGYEKWNTERKPTNEPPIFTWTPVVDKAWIVQESDGTWHPVIDPKKTNEAGADGKVVLDGDAVAAVVNGLVPAHLGTAPSQLNFVDDFVHADYLVDPVSASAVKVYESSVANTAATSIDNIVAHGDDVTSDFRITISGTKVSAVASEDYRKSLADMEQGRQLTILIPFTVNFANGGGAAQVREDSGKSSDAEVSFCSIPTTEPAETKNFVNAATQSIGGGTAESNQPYLCGFVPPVAKQVLAESSQGGDQSDINTKVVGHGQKVEYKLSTRFTAPQSLATKVTYASVKDQFSPYTTADKQTLEITDLASGEIVPKSEYTSVWDDANHTVIATFSGTWVASHFAPGQKVDVFIRFEARVNDDAPLSKTVNNQWELQLNNSVTPSNKVVNRPQKVDPKKSDTTEDPAIVIDGKTLLIGDTAYYRVVLDAAQLKDSAYKVQRLGLVDDFDEKYLSVDSSHIKMLDDAGNDVSEKFNIQVNDGVAYAFFKTVDTFVPATAETLPGSPQPTDLKAYSSQPLDPLTSPSIDQSVLGRTYTMVMPATVVKVDDAHVVKNAAVQVTNSDQKTTNTVVNPLKKLNPRKDVVVSVGAQSKNGGSIPLNSDFLYQVDSSVLPAHRAYAGVSEWSVVDDYDEAHDQFSGQWAIYASQDVLNPDGTVLFKKGALIQRSTPPAAGERATSDPALTTEREKSVESAGGDYFTFANHGRTFEAHATQRYLDLVSANTVSDQQWTLFVQMVRVAPGNVENSFDETMNKVTRHSNHVVTHTPKHTPSIDVEKFDAASGATKGDRDSLSNALTLTQDNAAIVFRITNTGDVTLHSFTLEDSTTAGTGGISDVQYPQGWKELELAPGEHVDITAHVRGIKADSEHTDVVSVTGVPKITCPVRDSDPFDDVPGTAGTTGAAGTPATTCDGDPLKDTDPWNARRLPASPLASTGSNMSGIAAASVLAGGIGVAFMQLRRARGRHGLHERRGAAA